MNRELFIELFQELDPDEEIVALDLSRDAPGDGG